MAYYDYAWGAGVAGYGFGDEAQQACSKPCYDGKGNDYLECRKIPVDKRADREACFKAADERLMACLRVCGVTYSASADPTAGGKLKTALLLAGGAVAAAYLLK